MLTTWAGRQHRAAYAVDVSAQQFAGQFFASQKDNPTVRPQNTATTCTLQC